MASLSSIAVVVANRAIIIDMANLDNIAIASTAIVVDIEVIIAADSTEVIIAADIVIRVGIAINCIIITISIEEVADTVAADCTAADLDIAIHIVVVAVDIIAGEVADTAIVTV
jgi:hypothetical protein